MNTGSRIRVLRKKKGMTLEQLAERVGSSKSYMWEIENKGKSVSADRLMAIATALNTTTDFLLGGSDYLGSEEGELEARDKAFYRKYASMSQPTKDKLQKMLDLLDDEDD